MDYESDRRDQQLPELITWKIKSKSLTWITKATEGISSCRIRHLENCEVEDFCAKLPAVFFFLENLGFVSSPLSLPLPVKVCTACRILS
ncbi:hypothetical protein Nepgr_018081 [Nepenthes gracilis]|uniref:Uncharacterized protein n=1 Tax=Nepenthes gracilis TaxID=150966 RepID=A0AAD3SSM1_NEPGR|nr:hypothetical protein Nepgr_018081 [Nepenthes gracilis]